MSSQESRSPRQAVGVLLGPVLHRGSLKPPRGLSRLTVRLNQAAFERSLAPPWVLSQAQCQDYWSAPTDAGNRPEAYSAKSLEIVDFLHRFWSPEVTPEDSILECGCNAGANLHGLQQLGYTDLQAVEINAAALEEMGSRFPDVREAATVHVGTLEEALPKLPSDSVDVVFSMAVLMHVHPKSEEVFREMARVARRYVCVLEGETATTPNIFARNYRRIFSRIGCSQIRSTMITPSVFPELIPEYEGYVARLFATSMSGQVH